MVPRTWHTCQPGDLHKLARQWFIGARRIELQKLATELGISRATAYRWAGSAEQLVSHVLASLVDDTFKQVIQRTENAGTERVVEVLERTMRYAHEFKPLQQLLAKDAQLGLKIVSSMHSPVQERTIANIQHLLEEEIEGGHLSLSMPPDEMANVLTRIVGAFLYPNLITGAPLELEITSRVLRLVLDEGR